MTRALVLVSLLLVVLGGPSPYEVERLIISTLTIYLIIAGFIVVVARQRAWDLIRPVLLLGLALLVVPPIARDLVRNMRATIPALSFDIRTWLIPVALAVVLYVVIWLLEHVRQLPLPRRREQRLLRARERVVPLMEPEDAAEYPAPNSSPEEEI